MPIYASPDSGYPKLLLLDMLLKPDIAPEHVCTVQPQGVLQNALFIVDVDVVNFEDLKADDLGSWKGTGRHKENVFQSSDVRCNHILRINLMQAYLPSIYN